MHENELSPRRGRPKTRDREQVLESAMHAFWNDDRATVSVNSICVSAKVSKPSLYRDFASEDGLTAAVLDRYAKVVLDPIEDMLKGKRSFSEKLDALIVFASSDPSMKMGCLFVKMHSTKSRFGEQTQKKLATLEKHFLRTYTRLLKDGAANGEWHGKFSPSLAADYLFLQLSTAFSQRAVGKKPESIRKLLTLSLSILRS